MGMSIDEMLDCFMRLKYAIEEGENVDSTTYKVYPVIISFKKEHCMEIKEVVDSAIDTMSKYQQLQADYEARLKADLKAILVELQLQMEEYEPKWVENDEQAVASCRTWEDLDGLIQQKINALKENEDGGN